MSGLSYIEISSGVSEQTRLGFCHVTAHGSDGSRFDGQLDPAEVRAMALGWLEAAEAADHDAAVLAELIERVELDDINARAFVMGLRDRRATQATSRAL
jgi:hypothetical protein